MSHNDIQDIDTSDFYSFGCYPMQRYTAIRAGTIGLFKTEAVPRQPVPDRSVARDRRRRVRDDGMGRLVPQPPPQPARLRPTRRPRGRPLRSNPYVPAGGASTVKPASTRNDEATPWPNTMSTLGNCVRRRIGADRLMSGLWQYPIAAAWSLRPFDA
jgi:hypothetical protein